MKYQNDFIKFLFSRELAPRGWMSCGRKDWKWRNDDARVTFLLSSHNQRNCSSIVKIKNWKRSVLSRGFWLCTLLHSPRYWTFSSLSPILFTFEDQIALFVKHRHSSFLHETLLFKIINLENGKKTITIKVLLRKARHDFSFIKAWFFILK